jgi:hypothetical protein
MHDEQLELSRKQVAIEARSIAPSVKQRCSRKRIDAPARRPADDTMFSPVVERVDQNND